jgi:hypothetical protein
VDKLNITSPHNGTLFGHKQEKKADAYYHTDKPGEHSVK